MNFAHAVSEGINHDCDLVTKLFLIVVKQVSNSHFDLIEEVCLLQFCGNF